MKKKFNKKNIFETKKSSKKVHILMAEDNKMTQIILRKLIEKTCGFKLTLTSNGEEAIQKWKSDPTVIYQINPLSLFLSYPNYNNLYFQ